MIFGTNVNEFPKYGDLIPELVTFVQTAEAEGYDYILFLDHVVGIVEEAHRNVVSTPYTSKTIIREVFTLLAYLSALTRKIRFVTGVIVLPQRETVLVAKQAAEVDILSRGRLTLGIGVGYNPVEYQVLGANYKSRGRRVEEQIALLREFWTKDAVSFKGEWHNFEHASLAPMPIQRPIPIWYGPGRLSQRIPSDKVLERIGRLADGWLPFFDAGPEAQACIDKVNAAARMAGRDPNTIGLEMNLWIEGKSPKRLVDEVKSLRDFGATHIHVRIPYVSPKADTEALARFSGEVIRHFK